MANVTLTRLIGPGLGRRQSWECHPWLSITTGGVSLASPPHTSDSTPDLWPRFGRLHTYKESFSSVQPLTLLTRETCNLVLPTPPMLPVLKLTSRTSPNDRKCGSMGATSLLFPRINCVLIVPQSSPGGLSLNLCSFVISGWPDSQSAGITR